MCKLVCKKKKYNSTPNEFHYLDLCKSKTVRYSLQGTINYNADQTASQWLDHLLIMNSMNRLPHVTALT